MPLRMLHESRRTPRATRTPDALPPGPHLERHVGVRGRLRRVKEWLHEWR